MSIEELIAKLKVFPGHYSVEACVPKLEDDDLTADIDDIKHHPAGKIVHLILDREPDTQD